VVDRFAALHATKGKAAGLSGTPDRAKRYNGVTLSSPITYDFTVTAISRSLNGDVETGSFTFDSGLPRRAGAW
jgi:hypothetical protein